MSLGTDCLSEKEVFHFLRSHPDQGWTPEQVALHILRHQRPKGLITLKTAEYRVHSHLKVLEFFGQAISEGGTYRYQPPPE